MELHDFDHRALKRMVEVGWLIDWLTDLLTS